MGSKSTKELLLESGIIPEDAIQQFGKWKTLSESEVRAAGSRPVFEEEDSDHIAEAKKQRFTDQLQQSIDSEDSHVKLTQLGEVIGEEISVRVGWSSGGSSSDLIKAVKDKAGNIHIPPVQSASNGRPKKISKVFFSESNKGAKKVVQIEPHYQDDKIVSLMLVLEE